MDISNSLSINDCELVETMGSILSSSHENEAQNTENQPANINIEEATLTSQNIEVNELQNVTDNENLPDSASNSELDVVESFTETLIEKEIKLIVMGKSSTNDDSEEVISSSDKHTLPEVPSTSNIEEHEELWLGDNTRHLVKVDTDEDFEVIVKSLETAIVETERYDIDTVITSNEEPVVSNADNSMGMSIVEASSDSILNDIPSDLLTSAVLPLPLPDEGRDEISTGFSLQAFQGERRARILDSPVENLVPQHRILDNYDEFAEISEPKVESFDDQSSSLFEVMEPELEIPIENEPSLLELQEATMPTDIPGEFQLESTILGNSEAAVENITNIDNLEEICEASNDLESLEKPDEELLEDEISIMVESLDQENTEKFTIKKNESECKNESSDSKENKQRALLKDIFEYDFDATLTEEIVTSTQLQNKSHKREAEYNENDSLVPELPLVSTSKVNEGLEVFKCSTIKYENQLESKIITDFKVGTELSDEQQDCNNKIHDIQSSNMQKPEINKQQTSEKNEYVKSFKNEIVFPESDSVPEEQAETVKCKNTSPEPNINKSVEKRDLKMCVETHLDNKSKAANICETNIKNIQDNTLTSTEIQKESLLFKQLDTNQFPSKGTQKEPIVSSSKLLKHSLESDKKDQSPPKKIKLVREKIQIKSVQKNISASVEPEKSIIKSDKITSVKVITPETTAKIDLKTVPIQEKKSVVSVGFGQKETIEQILEKLEDFTDKNTSEQKSPTKPQKLKLQRNYKLPQKSNKEVTAKKIEDPTASISAEKKVVKEIKNINTPPGKSKEIITEKVMDVITEKKMKEEVKSTYIAKDKSDTIPSNEKILSKILRETVGYALENVVTSESKILAVTEKIATESKDEVKSVELVNETEIDQSIKTVSATEISETIDKNRNTENINNVTLTVRENSSAIEQNIPEATEKNTLETNLVDDEIVKTNINLLKIQEKCIIDITEDVDFIPENEIKKQDSINQIKSQIHQDIALIQDLNDSTEPCLFEKEILVDKLVTKAEKIMMIENDSTEMMIQDLNTVASKNEEESRIINSDILSNQCISQKETSEIEISQNIKDTSVVETVEEINVEDKNIQDEEQEFSVVDSSENRISVAAATSSEVIEMVDDTVEKLLNFEIIKKKIKEPEVTEEIKPTASSNVETGVETIKKLDVTDSENNETKKLSDTVENNVFIEKFAKKTENENCNETKRSIEKTEPGIIIDIMELREKTETGITIDTKQLEEQTETVSIINTRQLEGKTDTENFIGTEGKTETVHIDAKQLEEKIEIANFVGTIELKGKTDTVNIIETTQLEEKNETLNNIDTTQLDEKTETINITDSTQLEEKTETANIIDVTQSIENTETIYNIDTTQLDEKTESVNVIDTMHLEEKTETVQIIDTTQLEEKTETVNIDIIQLDENIETVKNMNTMQLEEKTETAIIATMQLEKKTETVNIIDTTKLEEKAETVNIIDTTQVEEKKIETVNIIDTTQVEEKIENAHIIDITQLEEKTETANIIDTIQFEEKSATVTIDTIQLEDKPETVNIDTKQLKEKIETVNIIDAKQLEERTGTPNFIDTIELEEKTERKIIDTMQLKKKAETVHFSDIMESKKKTVIQNIINVTHSEHKIETENILDTDNLVKKINKNKSLRNKNLVDNRMKPEPKLPMNTQFPLLSSRLQERLEPKTRKYTDEVKITPVLFPTISQEAVSKKLQEQLIENMRNTKQDLFPGANLELRKPEAANILSQSSEITFTKEIADHSARMESATRIKISKRKLDTSGPTAKRSVTKPLSVQIDDLESTGIERSHSSRTTEQREQENIPKIVIKPIPRPEGRSSPKITIKPIKPPEETSSKSRSSEDSSHSPKITIKPIVKPDPLKITITKQKSDDTHSILKIFQPEDNQLQLSDHHIPKLTIKSISKSDEMQHSPRITIKPVKPSYSGASMSPKITVKPIPSPSEQVDIMHSPKITVKPIVNPEESYPKVTIKPVLRPEETHKVSQLSPRQMKMKNMTFQSSSGVTVEPISGTGMSTQKSDPDSLTSAMKISVKSFAKIEESLSPKLTIKPITKTCEIVQSEDGTTNPLKLTIKPILKPEESSYQSPKITIKPIVKPEEMNQHISEELDKPERIILKIQKHNLPSPKERMKDTKKEPEIKIEAIPHDPDKSQKLDKIKLKLTKEGSHAQIIPSISTISDGSFSLKRSLGKSDSGVVEKRSRSEFSGTEILHTSDISINIVQPNARPSPKTISEEVTIMKIDKVASGSRAPTTQQQISQARFKEMLMKIQQKPDITCTPHIEEPDYSSSSDDVKIVEIVENDPLKDPLSINDESNSQDVMIVNEVINTNPFQNIQIIDVSPVADTNLQTPKKRGRPRKNPLEVKPEIKGEDCVEVRPKRTCRAPPGRTPFAVKERKPRGAGRGRGGSRGRGMSKSPQKSPKEVKTPRGKALKEAKALAKIEAARLAQEVVIDEITIEDSTNDTPAATPVPPAEDSPQKPEVTESEPRPQMVESEPEVKVSQITPINEELPKQPPPPTVYEEETRMSADNSSRAQTPAPPVFTAPLVEGPEESQSSVQSSATTESTKTKKGRLEVCDPDSAVTTVDQIVEYSWANGGPYMLQEQIAQYLGVKSFKRKYPGLTRRPVEMQERDYIREKGLVSESMCDMGLTAVPSSEILDIMYSDFQEKYEEYRKCLRDKQAKEISNKQKAVSLATSQEKNKIDFKERAIRSAASWNLNFNKSRKDGRKCCMDLQTFTINYPAGKMKVPYKPPVGHYPVALVPGQYTDFYKSYTANDLLYLPFNTVRYGPVIPNRRCDAAQSDGSQSDSDSSSGSDSDSSDDSMSTEDDAPTPNVCKTTTVQLTPLVTTPKSKVH